MRENEISLREWERGIGRTDKRGTEMYGMEGK